MGLLDQILGGVLGQMGGQPDGQMTNQRASPAGMPQGSALLALALNFIQNYPGGLQGLLQSFSRAGLGQQAQSWVGTGQNMPISVEQLLQVLGQDQLQAMGRDQGIAPEVAAGGLAGLLPHIVDQITPQGRVDERDDLSALLDSVRTRLG